MSPTKLITFLTEAQKARFPEFVDKWTAIGLSTSPANRERAEAAIAGIYKLADLKKPRVIWLPEIEAAKALTADAPEPTGERGSNPRCRSRLYAEAE